jgi:hypothetical protein
MKYYDRVQETTTTSGTGNLTLLGAVTNFRAFASVYAVLTDVIPYAIVDSTNNAWETGTGYLLSSEVLVRNVVLASSNGGAVLNLAGATCSVFVSLLGMDQTRSPTRGKANALVSGFAMP